MIKISDVPQSEGTIVQKTYALYYPAQKNYVNDVSNFRVLENGKYHVSTARDPRFLNNYAVMLDWQLTCSMHGFETEIHEFDIRVTRQKLPQESALEHLINIKNELCREKKDRNGFDGARLFELLVAEHQRYLVFFIDKYDFKLSLKEQNSKDIKAVKSIVGKLTKCVPIDLRSKTSHRAVVFFENDLNSIALLKLCAEATVAVYDTEERKFL